MSHSTSQHFDMYSTGWYPHSHVDPQCSRPPLTNFPHDWHVAYPNQQQVPSTEFWSSSSCPSSPWPTHSSFPVISSESIQPTACSRESPFDELQSECTREANTSTAGKTRTKDKYRVVYSDHQRASLEHEFSQARYITITRKSQLARQLALSERQVKIWFQNRRAKDRRVERQKENAHSWTTGSTLSASAAIPLSTFESGYPLSPQLGLPQSVQFSSKDSPSSPEKASSGPDMAEPKLQ